MPSERLDLTPVPAAKTGRVWVRVRPDPYGEQDLLDWHTEMAHQFTAQESTVQANRGEISEEASSPELERHSGTLWDVRYWVAHPAQEMEFLPERLPLMAPRPEHSFRHSRARRSPEPFPPICHAVTMAVEITGWIGRYQTQASSIE